MIEARYRLVRELIEAGGLRIGGEYKLRSGEVSRVYIDARSLYSRPLGRRIAATLLAAAIEDLGVELDAIIGVATGGIGWALLAAEALGLPSGYVRLELKDHGLGRLVEGGIEKGSRVVLVDDVATTGGSLYTATRLLEDEGYKVAGIAVLFDRCRGAARRFLEASIPYTRVMTIKEVLAIASELGVDTSEAMEEVRGLEC